MDRSASRQGDALTKRSDWKNGQWTILYFVRLLRILRILGLCL